MLRIHFTAGDLTRTQVASAPDPMWESVLSLQMLHSGSAALLFSDWRAGPPAGTRVGQAHADAAR